MHQIRFRLGLCPRPRWGSSQRSPDPLAGFEGVLLLREGKGMGGKGKKRGRGRKGRKGKGREGRRGGRGRKGREKGREREGREGGRLRHGSINQSIFIVKTELTERSRVTIKLEKDKL